MAFMLAILPFFSCTTFSIADAFSRIAVATPSHLLSWSGVILSAALSEVMRCSTVSGLLEVAAAAAGGLPRSCLVPAVWAEAEPANANAPATVATAIARPIDDRVITVVLSWKSFSWKGTVAKRRQLPARSRLADLEAEGFERLAHALPAVHRLYRSEPVEHPLG